MKKKTGYHHGNLREALLDAADEELGRDPGASLSVRALAARIGVSATAPHAHFRTKQDLLAALATRGFERLAARSAASVKRVRGRSGRLQALAQAYLEFSHENIGLYRLMFAGGPTIADFPDLQKASSHAYGILAEVVAEAFPDLNENELAARTLGAWALVHGFASLASHGRIRRDILPDTSTMALARIAAELMA